MMKKKLPVAVLIVGMIVALDQWVKTWVQSNIAFNHEQPLIPGVIDLTHIWNFGAAWSSFSGQRLFFVIISVLALGGNGICFYEEIPELVVCYRAQSSMWGDAGELY